MKKKKKGISVHYQYILLTSIKNANEEKKISVDILCLKMWTTIKIIEGKIKYYWNLKNFNIYGNFNIEGKGFLFPFILLL